MPRASSRARRTSPISPSPRASDPRISSLPPPRQQRAAHAKKPAASRDSGRSDASRLAPSPAPAASLDSIDHLPLPPLEAPGDLGAGSLEALPLDELVGDLGDDFLPGVDAMLGGVDAVFAAAPEAPREVASSGHGPSVSRHSGETETRARADGFAVAAETAENDEESDDKKRARLVRNRESAMLSRQRKKQYVDELERKHRHAQIANAELQRLVQRLIAECEGLRHHLSLATGDPPVARGLILEHPPPPGMGLEAPPKVAIPRVAAAMPAAPKEKDGTRPPPVRTAGETGDARPDLLGSAGSAPGSPEQKHASASSHKRRRVAPGSSLAAAAAGALAVLSVVCIASERGGARRLPALASGGFAASETASHGRDGAPRRRLLALASGEEDLERSGMSDAKERVTLSALAATRAAAGEEADALEYRFANPDFETSGRSKASTETSPPFSVPYGGPDDPWYAAFGAAGLRRAEEFRRVACAEMFRFKPEGADPSGSAGVSVVASDAFSARLRAEMDAEAEEAGEPPRAERKEKEETKTPELLPSAIPMPASARETSAHAVMSSPSGLPAPPPRVSMSGIVDDDSSLVSVLLPPASAATKTKTVGAYDAASKLFVVTHSRRRGEYVTYSCTVP